MQTESASPVTSERADWLQANQQYLTLSLRRLSLLLRSSPASAGSADEVEALEHACQDILRTIPAPPTIERVAELFGLSRFERDLLLLSAASEFDGSFGALIGSQHEDPTRTAPTFSLALAKLPGAHWSALTPNAPLRARELIEVGPGATLTQSPLRIDEQLLHYIAGVQHTDERLSGLVEPLEGCSDLPHSHQQIAQRIITVWRGAAGNRPLPAIGLCGLDSEDKRSVAMAVCQEVGLRPFRVQAETLPSSATDIIALARRWAREAALSTSALYVDCEHLDVGDPGRGTLVDLLVDRIDAPVFVASRERRFSRARAMRSFDVSKPTRAEQHRIWSSELEPVLAHMNGGLDRIMGQFDLSAAGIRAATHGVIQEHGHNGDLTDVLWENSRGIARPRLEDLAQRIEPAASWGDLVLPEQQLAILHEISMHVRHRATVYERWGFASKGSRGLGISALFSGQSGTGKTTAAEVLANEQRLDLYRIDLSSIVSKYIGETEKNLRRVFDAADDGGAILLFDEADALFGKRTEVKDSHDRYANIEVSYLLQRMESYRGLSILTTNLKSALDSAFMRRIRFVVTFPFPDAAQRAEIWRRIFPDDLPTRGLDFDRLGRLSVSGGSIRNIAVNAAFIAAERGEPLQMEHILTAARTEYAKLEKTLTEGEIAGWE